ncbi:hypothetical protein GHK68_19485 [Sinorhizobium meliloti]|nr:hypothetical protein [Sinorhizobium meliloti]
MFENLDWREPANDNFRKCERCGSAITKPPRPGPKPRFCSDACRMPAGPFDANVCAHCGTKMEGRRRKFCDKSCRDAKRSEAAPKTGRPKVSGVCIVCDALFVGAANKIYCGEACARKTRDFEYRRGDKAPERECQWCGDTFRRRPTVKDAALFCSRDCGHEYLRASSAVVRISSFSVLRPRCAVCDKPFTAKGATAKYCSDDCHAEIKRLRSREYSAANDNVDRTPRPCAECGEVFSTSYGEKNRKFCSTECSKKNGQRAGKLKRKAMLRAAYVERVDPIKVFDRDKWKCQICGVKTPRKLRGTMDDRAPELDHVMPLSLGGAHSYMNTQCACRKCNREKSDTLPAQIGLFAYAS